MYIFRYLFKSGNPEHPGDKFYNTTVEVLPSRHAGSEDGILNNRPNSQPYSRTPDGYLVIGNFRLVQGVTILDSENFALPTNMFSKSCSLLQSFDGGGRGFRRSVRGRGAHSEIEGFGRQRVVGHLE